MTSPPSLPPLAESLPPFAAVLLTGGRGSRLGHVDKATLVATDTEDTLLARALHACGRAAELVVVGPQPERHDRHPGLRYVRESPVGSGPAAGLGAGSRALTSDASAVPLVVVLAVDMPHVTQQTVARLLDAAHPAHQSVDGAVLVSGDGRRHLALALNRASLARHLGAPAALVDAPLWRSLETLHLVKVPAQGQEHLDIDTPADLAQLRES